jgi:hypothetical protein
LLRDTLSIGGIQAEGLSGWVSQSIFLYYFCQHRFSYHLSR